MWAALIFYGAVGLLLGGLALLFFIRALASRRRYRCPSCGEEFRVELMSASHCNVCGAELEEDTYAGS